MIKSLSFLSLFLAVQLAYGHGHEHAPVAEGGADVQYAQRHMASEHHIDSFDLKSFFHLHDLDRDGVWNREEIEAIYGVHHVYSQKKSKDDVAHQEKADHIVNVVLAIMDKNKDGKISPEEFEASGLNGLPNFDGLGAEGHHYDVESEFFLHHEEMYHSTPETQTDEAYNHPEDIEHFAQHEQIERQEIAKEAKFQGIPLEDALAQHEHDHDEPSRPAAAEHNPSVEGSIGDGVPNPQVVMDPHNDQAQVFDQPQSTGPKITRQTPPEKQDPQLRYKDVGKDSSKQAEWGTGDGGYKPPKTPAEKLRKNVPYKYKFRRSWGDF